MNILGMKLSKTLKHFRCIFSFLTWMNIFVFSDYSLTLFLRHFIIDFLKLILLFLKLFFWITDLWNHMKGYILGIWLFNNIFHHFCYVIALEKFFVDLVVVEMRVQFITVKKSLEDFICDLYTLILVNHP